MDPPPHELGVNVVHAESGREGSVVPVEELTHVDVFAERTDTLRDVRSASSSALAIRPVGDGPWRSWSSRSSSSGLTNWSTPANTMSSSGRDSNSANCRASFVGSHRSSASRSAMNSPLVAEIPALRVAPIPACARRSTRTGAPKRLAVMTVASVDPSSTTRISDTLCVWSSTLRIASRRYFTELYAGITTLTVGWSGSLTSHTRQGARSPVIPAARRRSSDRFSTASMYPGMAPSSSRCHVGVVQPVDERDVGEDRGVELCLPRGMNQSTSSL